MVPSHTAEGTSNAHTGIVSADVDVAIVGAGLSGIGMAAHLQAMCPDRSFTLLERRENLGGTWDLFRYPGVRSDSDMHTLGFVFEPWKHEKSIADGEAILDYLNRIADERDIRRHIRFGSTVVSADWDSTRALWHIVTNGDEGRSELTARFLYLGSGYYDYDQPFDAGFEGREDFAGQIIHPQFWPEDLDYDDKRVVVIGSGATAVTIVPSMARKAKMVTMLQRTPTWYATRPAKDAFANTVRRILPEDLAYRLTRWKNVAMQDFFYKRARKNPTKFGEFLTSKIKEHLGDHYDAETFTPPYDPWDQRLCLVPDADLFEAIKAHRAEIVTDHIERFVPEGILTKSGKLIRADIIVTATGLSLAIAGKIDMRKDGQAINFSEHFYYKGCMFSNLPNLAVVFGYLNASWTLRADLNSEYVCKLLNHMQSVGADVATPVLPADHALEEDDLFDFSSGYIQRSKHIMPKSATTLPWRLNQDYRKDRVAMRNDQVDDGVMQFDTAPSAAHAQAAE